MHVQMTTSFCCCYCCCYMCMNDANECRGHTFYHIPGLFQSVCVRASASKIEFSPYKCVRVCAFIKLIGRVSPFDDSECQVCAFNWCHQIWIDSIEPYSDSVMLEMLSYLLHLFRFKILSHYFRYRSDRKRSLIDVDAVNWATWWLLTSPKTSSFCAVGLSTVFFPFIYYTTIDDDWKWNPILKRK